MKQKTIAVLLAAGCFSAGSTAVFAGEIEDLKTRIDKLESGQKSGFTTANGTTFSIGGYMQLDAINDLKGDQSGNFAQGRAIDMTDLPLRGSAAAAQKNTTILSARTSRLYIKSSTPVDGATVKTRLEFDFFTSEGSETYTNSAGPRLRHAYGEVGNWLAGQTWSTFMDVDSLPETLDFSGPTGQIFIRQPLVRYTLQTSDKSSLALAVENPHGDIRGGGTRHDRGPDLAGNWTLAGEWGHLSLRGLLRPLRANDGAGGNDASTVGVGGGLSGSLKLGAADTVFYELNAGKGIGRYIQDVNSAAAYGGTPVDLSAQKAAGGYVALQHAWGGTARSTVVYGATRNSNEGGFGAVAGLNKSTREAHANLIFNPYKPVDVGVEYIWGQRELEDGQKGDLRRLMASARFNF